VSEFCSTCKAPILWAITSGGHPMPINPDLVADGNLRLEHGPGAMPHVFVVPPSQREPGEMLYVAHFRTCPYADQHRRPRRGGSDVPRTT
jgi:hypothetical protein